MTKQEFLAMSSVHGLYVYDVDTREIFLVAGYRFDTDELLLHDNIDGSVEAFCSSYFEPIFHTPDDITKEIEHKGEKFVPIEKLGYSINYCLRLSDLLFSDALKLIEWHFDIAGLIEKGEAIDVNTLPETPYK